MPGENNKRDDTSQADAGKRSPLGGGQSFHLFTFSGINVSVHWSWFLVAVIQYNLRKNYYHSPVFYVAEYLSLFGIVLLHEFGHAFACRQVGGKSDHITLWPLGGIAFVQPPPRPGAVLWSIAAGPLVNVALLPVTWGLYYLGRNSGWETQGPDFMHYLSDMAYINTGLLVFNMLPIYPLDGGQIVQALLWFVIGRAWSLMVACSLGMLTGAVGLALAVYFQSVWYGFIAAFAAMQSWRGFQYGRELARLGKYPRIKDQACPACGEPALEGQRCLCECGAEFDAFGGPLVCPRCGRTGDNIRCLFCGNVSDVASWDKTGR